MQTRFLKRLGPGLVLGLIGMSWAAAQEPGSADLPSAESVLDRYVEVTGGAEAYESKLSEVSRGTMQIPAVGITGQVELYTRPGLQYMTVQIPAVGAIESGVKDGVVWENNVLTGPRILTGAAADLTISNARPNAALHWRDHFPEVQTVGVEDVDGEAAYRILLQTSGGEPITNFYGVDSGLLLKTQFTLTVPQFGEIPIEQSVGEYSDFGGVLTPSRFVIEQGGQEVVMTVSSVEVNVDIPDERFDLPEAVQALLE